MAFLYLSWVLDVKSSALSLCICLYNTSVNPVTNKIIVAEQLKLAEQVHIHAYLLVLGLYVQVSLALVQDLDGDGELSGLSTFTVLV